MPSIIPPTRFTLPHILPLNLIVMRRRHYDTPVLERPARFLSPSSKARTMGLRPLVRDDEVG